MYYVLLFFDNVFFSYQRVIIAPVFLDTLCIHRQCAVLCFKHKLGYFVVRWICLRMRKRLGGSSCGE